MLNHNATDFYVARWPDGRLLWVEHNRPKWPPVFDAVADVVLTGVIPPRYEPAKDRLYGCLTEHLRLYGQLPELRMVPYPDAVPAALALRQMVATEIGLKNVPPDWYAGRTRCGRRDAVTALVDGELVTYAGVNQYARETGRPKTGVPSIPLIPSQLVRRQTYRS